MHRITISTRTPYHSTPEQLEDLARRIRALDNSYEVVIPPEGEIDPRRRQVSWWEIVEVSLPWIVAGGSAAGLAATRTFAKKVAEKTVDKTTDELAERVAEQIINTVGEWIRDRRSEPESNRQQPAVLTLYGPDERVLKRIEYHGPEYKPTDSPDTP